MILVDLDGFKSIRWFPGWFLKYNFLDGFKIILWLCQTSYWNRPSRNSEFTHPKWWIFPVRYVNVDQRVTRCKRVSYFLVWLYLVGGFITPFWKNMKVNLDDYSQLNGNIKFMFQTTNQIIYNQLKMSIYSIYSDLSYFFWYGYIHLHTP